MAVGLALDDTLRPCLAAGNAGCRLALMCIGQLGRALAMRGHARFQVAPCFLQAQVPPTSSSHISVNIFMACHLCQHARPEWW